MIILEKFNVPNEYYDYKALRYAEIYGIVEYTVNEDKIIWNECYTNEGTFKHSLNLDTDEEIVIKIKKAYWE